MNFDELNEIKKIFDFESNLMQYGHTCLAEFQNCSPILPTKTKKLNYNNQMNTNLKHCHCILKFSKCLKNSFSSYSKKIAHFYFNILKPNCYHYQYKPKCSLHIFGICLIQGDFKCHMNILDSN